MAITTKGGPQFESDVIELSKLFTNEYVAQGYLAIVLKVPSDARARKYKVWGESHAKIFAGDAVEPYIIAAVLASRVSDWLRGSAHMTAASEIERLIAKRGSFHVAPIVAFLWRGSDNWNVGGEQLKDQLMQRSSQRTLARRSTYFRTLLVAWRTIQQMSTKH
jgi:hypothetical protein